MKDAQNCSGKRRLDWVKALYLKGAGVAIELRSSMRFSENPWAEDPTKTVISGFHSPVEQECLRLLLKGRANIIHFPAREIEHLRIRKRMLVVTLAEFKNRRMSRYETDRRNHVIADLVQTLCIPYATPKGNLEMLVT